MLRAKVVTVRGRVQRVGYRRYVLDAAQEEGVAGYVRNQPDGSVLIFAQGEGGQLSSFLERIRSPPPPALVKEVQERRARPSKSKAFRVMSKGLAEEIQEGFGAMQAEFRDYRSEFRDYRSEFRDYRGEFRGFASRTDGSFATMNQKYGEISEKLSAIMAQLADQLQSMRADAKETSMTLNESLKLLKEAVERLPKQN